jgi:hypothetical protein
MRSWRKILLAEADRIIIRNKQHLARVKKFLEKVEADKL